jgi:hypothetical protein
VDTLQLFYFYHHDRVCYKELTVLAVTKPLYSQFVANWQDATDQRWAKSTVEIYFIQRSMSLYPIHLILLHDTNYEAPHTTVFCITLIFSFSQVHISMVRVAYVEINN